MAYVTPDAVALRLGRRIGSSDLDPDLLDALIADACALVDQIVSADTASTWSNGAPAAVVPVIVSMIRRALDNPHGYTSESNMGYAYSGGKSEGIFATDDERRAILSAAGVGGVRSVDISIPFPRSPREGRWCWLDGEL